MAKVRGNSLLRSLDVALGIPLVWLLGVFKKRRPIPQHVRSIGLLRTACLGDTLLLSAIIPDLRERLPDARIVVFAGPGNAAIARLLAPDIEVCQIDAAAPFSSIKIMRAHRVDVAIDFGQWPRIDALLTVTAGARCTIGFATEGQFRDRCFDIAVPHSRELHELDNFRNLIRPLGMEPKCLPSIEVRPRAPATLQKRFVAFHLWPSGYMSHVREWPVENWQALAQRLIADGYDIVLTGTPSDFDRNRELIDLLESSVGVHNMAGALCLEETAALLKAARALVSVNTGIMHLGAAVGASVVAMNGPTSTLRWGALGDKVATVEPDAPGCGYLYLGFEYKGQRLDCMAHISVERTYDALMELLRQNPKSAPDMDRRGISHG